MGGALPDRRGLLDGRLPRPTGGVAQALAAELGDGWSAGTREQALACDVVTCVTPGNEPVVTEADLRPGLHLNMLGADGPGKAEATVDAVAACELYCDEWAQAAHGGELTGAVNARRIDRADVTDLGAVLARDARRPLVERGITLFDSTGLAIQDLAIAAAAYHAARGAHVQRRPLKSPSRAVPPLQRDVAVLALRAGLALGQQRLERGDQLRARLVRDDHVVDVAALGRRVGVGEARLVVVDQLLAALVGRRRARRCRGGR